MISRSEIRHACFRAKNGALTERNKKIIEIIEPLMAIHQRFENFSIEWDVLVAPSGAITLVTPEIDIEFIRSTCLEKQFQVKYGISAEMTPRKHNIITIVEIMMLDGKMSWENFDEVWNVGVDLQLKTIHTKLFTGRTQTPVTEAMIQASKLSADDSPHSGDNGVIELVPTKVSAAVAEQLIKNIK